MAEANQAIAMAVAAVAQVSFAPCSSNNRKLFIGLSADKFFLSFQSGYGGTY